jgi:hypothetical protein
MERGQYKPRNNTMQSEEPEDNLILRRVLGKSTTLVLAPWGSGRRYHEELVVRR